MLMIDSRAPWTANAHVTRSSGSANCFAARTEEQTPASLLGIPQEQPPFKFRTARWSLTSPLWTSNIHGVLPDQQNRRAMILEVAPLQIRPGQAAEFEAAFRTAQAIIASMPGYISHELQRCME